MMHRGQPSSTSAGLIRVFPRRTNATPLDNSVRFSQPGLFDEADEVHVSVTFTYDLRRAEQLARAWEAVAPGRVRIGGPATGMAGGDFTPGLYLRDGYTITSRGCPNRCWFCEVPRREGNIRELPIRNGWNVLDDNLLACSDEHIRAVFAMLSRQTGRVQFTGGLEAARLRRWHVEALRDLRPKQVFFAYDTKEDREPLAAAGRMLLNAGFTEASHTLRCYVLVGFPGDTIERAEQRLQWTMLWGFTPMAMLYRGRDGKRDRDWMRFQKLWARPAIIHAGVTR